jgi:hypothetical protein
MPSNKFHCDTETPTIRRWRIVEVEKQDGARSRHIWGHDVTNDRGRASTAITEFDRETMTATTRKGSNYKLVGAPGNSLVLETVWRTWCRLHGVVSEVDVTSEYFDIDRLFSN